MAVRTLTCYVLDCDDCGEQIMSVEYEGGTEEPHYDSAATCRARLVGDPDVDNEDGNAFLDGQHVDGRDVCGECNTKRICGERGHTWSDWGRCYCRGLHDERPPREGHENGCPEWRFCERGHCLARDERQAVPA